MRSVPFISCLALLFSMASCREAAPKNGAQEGTPGPMAHALGFQLDNSGPYPVLAVTRPWPNAKKTFRYAFIPKDSMAGHDHAAAQYDAVVGTPVENLVVTSTTHIPALEALGGLTRLKGFPDTKYISSMPARELIAKGDIKELGQNERLNVEMVLELRPDAVVGFAMDANNASYELLSKAGIPVLYNGDWTEQTPLGKAEWIKFFGVLLGKEDQADRIFKDISANYRHIKELAKEAKGMPTVLSGALYKDVWYLPAGESWAAQFIRDANARYLWEDTQGTGSLSLSLESVLEKGREAEFWISPSQFKSYAGMAEANEHYQQFGAFHSKNIHTFSATVGPTGGLLFYELGPQRPDMILKDLVHIFHPELLPDYQPFFFKPLQ
ncbi:ABC transporter substrate-binding protein [Maribacter sp. 2307ULW6-5]|uniref:ABC transporter substrate-binding protein n=1 Tax=Maribacter sp. 2307ULW6-5 TaxID=3386275 RepID=UPI0039BD6948